MSIHSYINTFHTAEDAFDYFYNKINSEGTQRANGTKRLRNIGFYILKPEDNHIETPFRNWNDKYAKREFDWYLSQNRSVEELKKFAPIWDIMHNGDNIVNSNYGWQWNRNNQIEKCISQLQHDSTTRHAWLSIFDGKEKKDYRHDTPCTLNIGFEVSDCGEKLDMTVLMRSNDLWFGFCNDQYCFSEMHKLVAKEMKLKTGTYFHYAADLHLYNDFLNRNETN